MRVRTLAGTLALVTSLGACSEDAALSNDEQNGVETGGAAGEPATGGANAETGGRRAETGGRSADTGGSTSNDEGGAGGAAGGEPSDPPGAGGSGGEVPASSLDGWWRTENGRDDLIVIEHGVITEFRVGVLYQWDGQDCYADMVAPERVEIRDDVTTFEAAAESAPGAIFELTLEFSDGPNGTKGALHLAKLDFEGEVRCPTQDLEGNASVSFGPWDYTLYVWRERTGPPIDFEWLGAACLPPGCPLIDGEIPDFCDPDSLSTFWLSPIEICADSDLTQGCTGWQQNEKYCTKYCETDADCAEARVPMICNLSCSIGPQLNTCMPADETDLCWELP